MIIISHRGYWKSKIEENSKISFERSFDLGFGIETDIRDYKGELVISHEVPDENCMPVRNLFEIYNQYGNSLPLALNIKSDGLQARLKELILEYRVKNYFIFDTSIPDGLEYLKHGLSYFTRQSEHEYRPSLYDNSSGVWMDEFERHWISADDINEHIINNKLVCIVSPELHNRIYIEEWHHYQEIQLQLNTQKIMLCTDYPEEARSFFYEK